MSESLTLVIEHFSEQHPGLRAKLLVEPARAALEKDHASPAKFVVYHGEEEQSEAAIQFEPADPRTKDTLERETIEENGAIVLAGLLLTHFHGKQIIRVVGRGSKVDYFVGDSSDGQQGVLEGGGTDNESFVYLWTRKPEQLESSPYR